MKIVRIAGIIMFIIITIIFKAIKLIMVPIRLKKRRKIVWQLVEVSRIMIY